MKPTCMKILVMFSELCSIKLSFIERVKLDHQDLQDAEAQEELLSVEHYILH